MTLIQFPLLLIFDQIRLNLVIASSSQYFRRLILMTMICMMMVLDFKAILFNLLGVLMLDISLLQNRSALGCWLWGFSDYFCAWYFFLDSPLVTIDLEDSLCCSQLNIQYLTCLLDCMLLSLINHFDESLPLMIIDRVIPHFSCVYILLTYLL